ncbi:related to HDA1 complex subunit 3 [Nakaseomyces glabratus]|nr:Class II histone deacetylase complex subunits 2 and 3 [Nakaseomyces glabratus]QNG14124.1 uncharacterized protein GWK60_G09581 [Nakaseomyces glabratus]SCV14397.1 related to HDA1 complex subunit 3 [Nakaseomyces glabratus]SLM13071.1 related to HDA1 complex subunit 3 [Nakaseomyces glabratus]
MDLLKILDTKPVPSIVDARTLGVSGNTSGNYWLPTTMSLYQKELTDQIVSLHYSDILRYFETTDYKEDVILESMKTLCHNSELVATHPFLLIDHMMPKSLGTRDIPGHLAENSGKFQVIRDLINLIQEYETNTAIVCRPGRTMDLVEALLYGHKVNIRRYDGQSIKQNKKSRNHSCICHIFPSAGWDKSKFPLKTGNQFDMLLAVDISVDTTTEEMKSILRHERDQRTLEKQAPIVKLITINSVEHGMLYFGKLYDKNSNDYLEALTAAVVVLRDRVGTLPPDLRPVYSQKLVYLLDWLENPSIIWPLPDVYPIKRYNSMDVERSLLTEVHFNQIDTALENAFANSKKRGRSKSDKNNDDNGRKQSFYQLKRVKNDYSTNPLKQGMTQLTGITTADETSNSNYHLSSGILTHKLIQSIDQIYIDIDEQKEELGYYSDHSELHKNRIKFFDEELIKVKDMYDTSKSKIEMNLSQVNDQDHIQKELYEKLEKLNAEIDSISKKINSEGGKKAEILVLLNTHKELMENVRYEEKNIESYNTERQYMEQELERANNAYDENEKETIKITDELKNKKHQFRTDYSNTEPEEQKINIRINDIKQSIVEEAGVLHKLEGRLEQVLKSLHNMPPSRVRTSTVVNGNKRSKKS